MSYDLQKASLWKRIAAGILDMILVVVLATGFGALISKVVNYDSYEADMNGFAQKHGIDLTMTEEKLNAMTPEDRTAYEAKVEIANQDTEGVRRFWRAYDMIPKLVMVIVTFSVLLAMLVVEFILPLIFKNGQTLGKKVFSLCLVRVDGVQLNGYQHFIRAILGKFAVETMIPVYVAVMVIGGQPAGLLLIAVIILLIAQCVLVVANRNHSLIHDLMAGTVVVDYTSQKIFKSTDDLIAYQKKLAADRALRQDY